MDGFGFIKSDAFPENLFFHHTELQNRDFNELAVGDEVRFEAGRNEKGSFAKNVEILTPH